MADYSEIFDLVRKMDALKMWERLSGFSWAVKPQGIAFPLFCTIMFSFSTKGRKAFNLMMLDGWSTFFELVQLRMDPNFGFWHSPLELPQFTISSDVAEDGPEFNFFRRESGYAPRPPTEGEAAICRKVLWETYGIMLRLESEKDLPMRYSREAAIFARVEKEPGVWEDRPLKLVQRQPHMERFSILKKDVATAKDLPFATGEALAVDFFQVPHIAMRENRPREVFCFLGTNAKTGEIVFHHETSVNAEEGYAAMWEKIPQGLLDEFIHMGKVHGEILVDNGRMFRILRILCPELPIKLMLKDRIPALEEARMRLQQDFANQAKKPAPPGAQHTSEPKDKKETE